LIAVKLLIGKVIHDPNNHKKLLLVVALVIIAITFGLRYWLLQSRTFDPDEFEHMHSAWLISQGFLPYIDYFEHHTPAMHFLLAQFFRFFNVESDSNQAVEILILSRRIMWFLTGVILILSFKLGKTWENWRIGLLGTVFLVCTLMFQEKTIEIRPDLLSIPLWLACLFLLMQVVSPSSMSEVKKRWLMAVCGFLLGSSIMVTQKMLFAMPGFTVAMLVYWFHPNSSGTFNQRFTQILFQLVGFFTPILLMIGYFELYNGGYAFIEYNLLLNLGWKVGFSPAEYIQRLLEQNPFIVGFGLLGLLWAVPKLISGPNLDRGDYIIAINLVGLIIGLFIIPVPWRQYYLMFLPLLALFAARFLINVIDKLANSRTDGPWTYSSFWTGSILFLLLAAGLLLWTFPSLSDITLSVIAKKSFIFTTIVCGMAAIYFKKQDLALAILLVAVHLPTAKKFKNKFNQSNREQLTNIQYVIDNSSPTDTFMDGWKGIGLFRPHAYFYWMLHEEIRGMLTENQKEQLLDDLEIEKIRPYFVNLDEDLIQLSPEITAYFKENYQPVDVADLYRRKSN